MAHHRRSTVVDTGQRQHERRQVNLPARVTWKDASGAVRFVSVTTRDLSDAGVFVECEGGAAIPLHRLVHVQVERSLRATDAALPAVLRDGRVLAAVWRVAPCRKSTGTPTGYALRLLVEPRPAVVVADEALSMPAGMAEVAAAS